MRARGRAVDDVRLFFRDRRQAGEEARLAGFEVRPSLALLHLGPCPRRPRRACARQCARPGKRGAYDLDPHVTGQHDELTPGVLGHLEVSRARRQHRLDCARAWRPAPVARRRRSPARRSHRRRSSSGSWQQRQRPRAPALAAKSRVSGQNEEQQQRGRGNHEAPRRPAVPACVVGCAARETRDRLCSRRSVSHEGATRRAATAAPLSGKASVMTSPLAEARLRRCAVGAARSTWSIHTAPPCPPAIHPRRGAVARPRAPAPAYDRGLR